MGLFDFFPYTSGHTLNLDWIIKTVKKLGGDIQIFKEEVNAKVATIPAEVVAEVAEAVSGITAADINAAPGGYGLGMNNGKVVTDANTATYNGWYTIYNNGQNLPGSSYGGALLVCAYPSNNVIQTLFYTGHGGGECRRARVDGVWGEWEYVTPPLYAGVEYRTVERWQGSPVYTKLVNCGNFPAQGATSYTEFAIGVKQIVKIDGSVADGAHIPYISTDAKIYISGTIVSGTGNIVIYAELGNLSASSCLAQLWYTKE